MYKTLAAALLATVLAGSAVNVAAQDVASASTRAAEPLSRAEAAAALKALDAALDTYVFPEAAAKARKVLKAGWSEYLAIGDKQPFAERLTRDVGAALDDRHFYVRAGSTAAPAPGARPEALEAAEAYGIAAVQRMPGNVGYIDLRHFSGTDEGARRAEAAMDLVQDTQALIIDLRANRGGGGAAMSALVGRMASTPIPRSELIWREGDAFTREPGETTDYPAEKRYARPVFLLTADFTVSAAEAFAYDLQAAGRVTVVGETTRGGANPMSRPPYDLGAGLRAWVSNGRSEHPVTKGTPNGTGVKPDVPTAPADALTVAYARALQDLPTEGLSPAQARELAQAKADAQAALTRNALI